MGVVIQLYNQTIFQYNTTVTSLAFPHSHSTPTTLLSYRTATVRYLLLTLSPFKYLSVHNPLLHITNGS